MYAEWTALILHVGTIVATVVPPLVLAITLAGLIKRN